MQISVMMDVCILIFPLPPLPFDCKMWCSKGQFLHLYPKYRMCPPPFACWGICPATPVRWSTNDDPPVGEENRSRCWWALQSIWSPLQSCSSAIQIKKQNTWYLKVWLSPQLIFITILKKTHTMKGNSFRPVVWCKVLSEYSPPVPPLRWTGSMTTKRRLVKIKKHVCRLDHVAIWCCGSQMNTIGIVPLPWITIVPGLMVGAWLAAPT